ncbi:expressed unknown protein [Seminavis robusta]|uniref:Uncharacterized protein n=1 Tax=Seminavis robusta TaxID=568900 RepID=A0A9N8HTQ4_9STRA|nr:expressed unknown protein [Seminavis robusta]|eukprot:Sro1628_g287020.1 n/a (324) ;mRNA; f:18329-19746
MGSLLDEKTMVLTQAEIRWAWAIKHAIKDSNDKSSQNDKGDKSRPFLKEVSDYELAHLAMVTHGDVDDALERVEKIQYFKEEYRISDSAEEGMFLLEALQRQQPWFVVNLEYCKEHGHFTQVYDYAKLNPAAVDYPNDWRVWLGGLYYIGMVCHSNLLACREGVVVIGECEGMEYRNFSVELLRRTWYHLVEFSPHIYKEYTWLHTPMVGNLQQSFVNSLMSPTFGDSRILVGCQFTGYEGRLDELFKCPTEEAALARLMDTCFASLTRFRPGTKCPLADFAMVQALPLFMGGVLLATATGRKAGVYTTVCLCQQSHVLKMPS